MINITCYVSDDDYSAETVNMLREVSDKYDDVSVEFKDVEGHQEHDIVAVPSIFFDDELKFVGTPRVYELIGAVELCLKDIVQKNTYEEDIDKFFDGVPINYKFERFNRKNNKKPD